MTEHFEAHWILSPRSAPLYGGQVRFERDSGRIEAVGKIETADLDSTEGSLFLTPGLVNAHTHLELGGDGPIPLLPGQSMADWLQAATCSRKEQTAHDLLMACEKNLMEVIRTGTTCINDITTDGASAQALAKVGMRGVVSPEFFYPAHNADPDMSGIIDQFDRLKTKYAGHPLIEIGISPHSPYNVSLHAWEKVLKATDPFLIHTHLAETREEVDYFRLGHSDIDTLHERILGRRFGPAQSGVTSVEAVAPVLNDKTVAAHGVFLTDGDIGLLRSKGVKLVHCPRSNAWLSGNDVKMPLIALYEAGIPLGIGTDSKLSNTDLDLRAEGRFCQNLYGLKARDVFDFMTHCSADVLGLCHRIGRLAPGYETDMVLWWNPTRPEAIVDPYEIWLSPETEAVTVWIRGRIVLERAGVLGD